MSFTPSRSDAVTDGVDDATVRDLAAGDALNVAIVDGTGAQVTSFGGGTQYQEDTPAVSGDTLTLAGVVQQSADAALSGDGDRSLMQVDANGFLKVNVKAGSSGGVSHTDDAPFTVTVDDGVPAFGMFDDVAPDSVDEGDAGALRMSANRNLYTQIRDGTAERSAAVSAANALKVDGSAVTQPVSDAGGSLSVDDNGGSLTVDAPVGTPVFVRVSDGAAALIGQKAMAASLPVAVASDQSAIPVTDNGGSLTVDAPVGTPAFVRLSDGAATLIGQKAMAASLPVVIASDQSAVTVADGGGSLTVDGTVTANQGTAGTAWEVVGDVAADIGVPGNPVAIGGRASTAQPTAVSADGDSVYEWMTRRGSPVPTMAPHVGLFAADPWTLTSKTAQYTTTQTSTVLVDGGASERLVVTYIQIQAGGTTAGTVQVYFGTGAYTRGTNLAIFDGEFAPSSTLKPGFTQTGPFISVTNGDDIRVTDSAAINPLTVTVWYYVVT